MRTQEQKLFDRDVAITRARIAIQSEYCVIDTETTGLSNPHMVQIALVYKDGFNYETLVKPAMPIEAGATSIHHITNKDVADAPEINLILDALPKSGYIIIYNAPFDLDVIKRSAKSKDIDWSIHPVRVVDAMQIYSSYKGEWDEYHGNYKWHKLGLALEQANIKVDKELHDALADALMTDLLMKYIAHQKLSTNV